MSKRSLEAKLASRNKGRARNRAFIDEVNARTVCAHCGTQPVEWHNTEHVELGLKHRRIGFMVTQGAALKTLMAELERCTPLCRRCHMAEDGRLRRFVVAGDVVRYGRQRDTSPCLECGRVYFPLRRGRCERCSGRAYRAARAMRQAS